MSNNALDALRDLIGKSTSTVKYMTVSEIVDANHIAVVGDNERRVVVGSYPIDSRLLVNGVTVMGVMDEPIQKFYCE